MYGFDLPGSASGWLQHLKSGLLSMQFLPRFRATDSCMADSIASSLANILAYIWTIVLAFFVGQPTSARSELPLGAIKGSSGAQALRSSEFIIEKEHFLRHPSLGSKRKGRQKDRNAETSSKQYRSPSIFPSRSSIQYFNSFVHRSRAEPATVPVVIITPSTPTSVIPVAELLLPSLSTPLELSDATEEPSHHLPISNAQSVSEDIGELSSTLEKQVSIPPDIENDISDIEFDSWIIPAAQASLEKETAESSFFLPEALQKIAFEPIRCASHALSAVSNILCDVPVWSGVEAPGDGMPAYFTSTPPKQSVKTKLRDIENNYIDSPDPPSHDTFYQYTDLIPYPDVFDLDMYYDATIPLKKLRKSYRHDCIVRNALSLESDDLTDPPPYDGLPSDDYKKKSMGVISCSSPVTFKPCHDDNSQSPSTRSISDSSASPLSSQSQPQHRRPLDESTNTFFRSPTTTSAMTSPSSTFYSIEMSTSTPVKSQREPISSISASAHNQRSYSSPCCQRLRTSLDSESESDAGSMDALNARLWEAYDGFSTPTFTEEMEIWEPVPF